MTKSPSPTPRGWTARWRGGLNGTFSYIAARRGAARRAVKMARRGAR
jgi:hypothetical protein